MSDRDANRGGCSQSCRWKYDLYDMPFGQERKRVSKGKSQKNTYVSRGHVYDRKYSRHD